MELKVMTFNIHHGKGMDGKVNLERIAFVIEQSGADYISLNEVDRCFSKRSHFEDQIAVIAKKLNMYYAYGPALTFTVNGSGQLRQYGNGFLSRFPIESQYNHLFNARSGRKVFIGSRKPILWPAFEAFYHPFKSESLRPS